jgi:hypothetical protein
MKTCGGFGFEVVQFAAFVRMRDYRKQKWCLHGATVVLNAANHGMPHRNGTVASARASVSRRLLDGIPNPLEHPRTAEILDGFTHCVARRQL